MGFQIEDGVLKKYTKERGKTEVTIPDSVTEIGYSVFEGCTSLTSVTIPDSVTVIAGCAFEGCTSLTSVTIPDSVTVIAGCAFEGCTSLTSVTIPDSVTEIGWSAFEGCTSLTSVTIPDSVTEIDHWAFKGCTSLGEINVSKNFVCFTRSHAHDTKWYQENSEDFIILGARLLKYQGKDSAVTIPDSVTVIGDDAFEGCTSLTSVTIPDSVTEIGKETFQGCTSLTSVTIPDSVTEIGKETFQGCTSLTSVTIPDSVTEIGICAFKGCTSLTSVTIPDSVTVIAGCAFEGCTSLTSVTIPDGVTEIARSAFEGCTSLTSVTIPDSVTEIARSAFKGCTSLTSVTIPDSVTEIGCSAFEDCTNLTIDFPHGISHLTDYTLKKFVIPNWKIIQPHVIAKLFITKHSKPMLKLYTAFSGEELSAVGKEIPALLGNKPSAKLCNAAGDFITIFYLTVDADVLKAIYDTLSSFKTGEKAVGIIQGNDVIMKKIGSKTSKAKKMNPAEEKVLSKFSENELLVKLKQFYTLDPDDLPVLKGTNKKKLNPVVLAYLLTVHEDFANNEIFAAYEEPSICPEAKDVLQDISPKSWQEAVHELVIIGHIGESSYYRKNMLSFPICRYADETLMGNLTDFAPGWRTHNSGNDAPVLRIFREACLYSECECVMAFSERMHDLERYAEIRGTDAEALRDTVLSAVDLDENGCHTYDLGNQVVTARFTSECTFVFEAADGKISKSLPKKGADSKLYEKAKAEFSKLKTDVNKVFRKRCALLFADFLSGSGKAAASWYSVYTGNVALKQAARLIVWQQGDKTFTISDNGLIDSSENAYTFTEEPVIVAHPMEMHVDDLERWQKYFASHGLKQPFAQVWEPVHNPETEEIRSDRYAGCMIPYGSFLNKQKHGIHVEDEEFHNLISIYFDDLDADVERIDWRRHDIDSSDRFEVKNISFYEYTRQTNHIIAFLDKLTVWGRVENDDVSVVQLLPGFTLAQICEFITAAQEANAVNVLAQLLEYKNNTFPDFDPMDKFTLDW